MAESNNLATLYIEIKADVAQLKTQIADLKTTTSTATKEMSTGFNTLGGTFTHLKGLLAGIGITVGMTAIIGFFKESIEKAGIQELAEKKLTVALHGHSKALIEDAAALQKLTTYGDEDIIVAQARIAAFTQDENIIKSLTRATLDFAAAKGIDLVSAADLLAKSFGSSTNILKRYGVEINGAAGSTERATSITLGIAKLWGGQASAAAQTYSGRILQLKNKFGDLQEKIGNQLIPSLITLATKFDHLIDFVQTDKFKKAWDFFNLASKFSPLSGNLVLGLGDTSGGFLNTGFDQYSDMVTKWDRLALKVQNTKFGLTNSTALNDLNRFKDDGIKSTSLSVDDLNKKIKDLTETQSALDISTSDGKKEYQKLSIEIQNAQNKVDALNKSAQDALNNKQYIDDLIKGADEIQLHIKLIDDKLKSSNLTEIEKNALIKERLSLEQQLLRNQVDLAKEDLTGKILNQKANNVIPQIGTPEDLKQKAKGIIQPIGVPQKPSADVLGDADIKSKVFNDNMQKAGNATTSILYGAENIASKLGLAGNTFAAQMLSVLDTITSIASSIGNIIGAITGGAGGLGGFLGLLFGANGGTFMDGKKIPSFAGGGSMIVPPGFPNDSFPVFVQSGERLTVTPKNSVNSQETLLTNIVGAINSLRNAQASTTMTLMKYISNGSPDIYIDGEKITKNIKSKENRLNKNGKNLNVI